MEESLKQTRIIFNRLRVIYERVNELVVDPNENAEEVRTHKLLEMFAKSSLMT